MDEKLVKTVKVHEFMEFTLMGTNKRILIRTQTILTIFEGDNCSIIECGDLGDYKVEEKYDDIKRSY